MQDVNRADVFNSIRFAHFHISDSESISKNADINSDCSMTIEGDKSTVTSAQASAADSDMIRQK